MSRVQGALTSVALTSYRDAITVHASTRKDATMAKRKADKKTVKKVVTKKATKKAKKGPIMKAIETVVEVLEAGVHRR